VTDPVRSTQPARSTPTDPSTRTLRIGSRRSPLARAQSDRVAALLARHGIASTFVPIVTTGDVDRRELTQIGGTGVFVTAVRDALLTGGIDLAVHSAKDLPSAPAAGLTMAAVPERADVRDVLVGVRLADLRSGMRVGTGSPRRAVQLTSWARARGIELAVVSVRGNVDTRLRLVGVVDAVLLAAAGLARLGLLDTLDPLTHEVLATDVVLPAGGQGALAVEIADTADETVRRACALLDHPRHHAEIDAERAFLAALGVGCLAPVGVLAQTTDGDGTSSDLTMAAVIGKTLGVEVDLSGDPGPLTRLESTGSVANAERVGVDLARRALTDRDQV